MMDYGAIAFKNGKLISTDMFTPMIDMVGWEDTENDVYEIRSYTEGELESNYMKPINLKGNYFAYVGDKDCTIAFYKEQMVIAERYNDGTFNYRHEFLNCTYYKWSKWEDYVVVEGEEFSKIEFSKIKVTKRNGYLVCKWKYKGDKYKVYFGYGVDLRSYEKYRIVNHYRSPMFMITYKIPEWFKDKIHDYKYYR